MDTMTIGEISRSLARLEQSQREQIDRLDEIKEQTLKTNGFVGRHEERLSGIDREIRDIKRAKHSHELKRSSDNPDAITVSIPTNKKAITVILSAAGAILAATGISVAKLLGWM